MIAAGARLLACLLAFIVLASAAAGAKAARPDDGGPPTEISASVIVLDIDAVDDAGQAYEASVFFELSWRDPRLVRAPGEPPPLAADIWLPLVGIGNQQRAWTVMPERVDVSPDGEVQMRRHVWGSFSQPLDLRLFPFDAQVFTIRLISEAGPEEIAFVQQAERPSGISRSLSVPDWRIVGTRAAGEAMDFADGIAPIASFLLEIEAERRSQYFVLTMILPLVVIVGMSFVAFWVDPSNFGTQIAIASTSMLTVITYRAAAVQVLPRTDYFTNMDWFIAGCTVLVFLALLIVVATTVMARRGREEAARGLDRRSRIAFPTVFAVMTAAVFWY